RSSDLSDFENIINIHKLSVAPAPPIHTNHWKNGSTIICGNGSPAALASIFWSNKENQMGWNTAPMTATPCIPADHKSTMKNTGIKAPNKLSPAKLPRSEEHTSELQSRFDLVCRLLLENNNRS